MPHSAEHCVAPKVLELFAGIGGLRAAWSEAHVVAAFDIDRHAREVYLQSQMQSHAESDPAAAWADYHIREIQSLTAEELSELNADLWWMSPPCQPYTTRGKQLDIDDARAASLLHLIGVLERCRPRCLCLENVAGFKVSRARHRLETELRRLGYAVGALEICPSEMGWPNRRPRFYLLATLEELRPPLPLPRYQKRLTDFVSRDPVPESSPLWLSVAEAEKYRVGLDRVSLEPTSASSQHPSNSSMTACFASSYGKAILRAGSYLQVGDRLRRFSPAEVAGLLGFADSGQWQELPLRRAWKLLGNSLSIPAVRYVVAHLPGGPAPALPWLTDNAI